ncbi:MAG: response regulator transcription factor [Rhodothermales bacterium]
MKQTLYIVEDNLLVQEALVMLIEDEPDLVVCGVAETAIEALEVLSGVSPDLILTDFSLPGMNGIELIERLRVRMPGQRAAMLSGQTDPTCAERALAAGANGYILKGDPLAMLEGIRQILDGTVYVSR